MDAFRAKEVGEIYLVYPRFVSTLRQEPTKVKLLPVDLESVILASEARPESKDPGQARLPDGQARMTETQKEFIFEPEPDKLLDYILVHHIQIRIYQALLETKASEHSARMVAMQNATDNALEMVDDLNLTYNQTRQDAITKELLDITTAALAM